MLSLFEFDRNLCESLCVKVPLATARLDKLAVELRLQKLKEGKIEHCLRYEKKLNKIGKF